MHELYLEILIIFVFVKLVGDFLCDSFLKGSKTFIHLFILSTPLAFYDLNSPLISPSYKKMI